MSALLSNQQSRQQSAGIFVTAAPDLKISPGNQ